MSYRYVSTVTPNSGVEIILSKDKKTYICSITYKGNEVIHKNTKTAVINEDIEYTLSKIFGTNDVFIFDFFADELLDQEILKSDIIHPIPRDVRILYIDFEW